MMYLEVYRHVNRGSLYHIIGTATLYFPEVEKPSDEEDLLVVVAPIAQTPSGFMVIHKALLCPQHLVLGTAKLQTGDSGTLTNGTKMVVYRGTDDRLWARSYQEFHDGRFKLEALITPSRQYGRVTDGGRQDGE